MAIENKPASAYAKPHTSTGTNLLGENGYPNNVANTQTLKTRGTGAATKGTNSSKRMA